ncbi:MAG: FecR domain-containing protein [Bacteroidota bacterium]
MATPEQIKQWADQYLKGTISETDKAVFDEWYNSMPDTTEWNEAVAREDLDSIMLKGIRQQIKENSKTTPVHRVYFLRHRWVAAAAILILVCSTGLWFFLRKEKTNKEIAVLNHDVAAPANSKATLSVGDGKKILLSDVGKGSLAVVGAEAAFKTADGAIVYEGKVDHVVLHTINNPRGSKVVDIVLPDGTKVWLNAGSSITYPNNFIASAREVTMTGEAFFEVTHNEKQPFIVTANNQQIEDLGTAFNVNAYSDEAGVTTTLVQGSVIINKAILQPGQQYLNGIISKADIESATAWKNGSFVFNGADLPSIMRQVERWYDVEVVYEGAVPSGHYVGSPSRDLTAAQMLKIVEYSGVKFSIEGKKIIIKE